MSRIPVSALIRIGSNLRRLLAAVAVAAALFGTPGLVAAAQPPATAAAQDGFLPVDESKAQEQLPAAPLLMTAYAVAWAAIFVYVWSLWSRLAKVEHEIVEVSRRIDAGSRR
ncbi:MAG: CcmD family protein [Vicinamibacterales bacterium]